MQSVLTENYERITLFRGSAENSTLTDAFQEYGIIYLPACEGYADKISLELYLQNKDGTSRPKSLRFEKEIQLGKLITELCESYAYLCKKRNKSFYIESLNEGLKAHIKRGIDRANREMKL